MIVGKTLLALVVLLPLASSAFAQRATCDPRKSPLCKGLVSFYNFEEASDGLRRDSFGYYDLREKDGQNIGQVAGKLGSYAGNFPDSTLYALMSPAYGFFGAGYWSVAAWVYPLSVATTQTILSTYQTEDKGMQFVLVSSGSNLKPAVYTAENETDTVNSFTSTTTVSANAWHLIVLTMSPYGPYGKAKPCLSVDGAAFQCGSLGYTIRGTANDLWVGVRQQDATPSFVQPFNGRIDGLLIAARTWSPADLAYYWNGGTGRAFPFY